MEFNRYSINLIFIFALNVLFFFAGLCLNSLVIACFWRSEQLRKKLCYFMIMVLSCCDLLAVLTNHPLAALIATFWLTENFDVYPGWMMILSRSANLAPGSSLLALLVMNFDRYLATHHPFFHRTSVTKRKLFILFAVLVIFQIAAASLTVSDAVLTHAHGQLIALIIISPPMLFVNYKLYTISRKSRRNNEISPEMKKTFSWKNISSCLLAVVCFVLFSIPAFLYSGLKIDSKKQQTTLDNAEIVSLWGKTIASMNSTFNCLIFYWKNKILRTEGLKIVKGIFRKDQC